MKNYILIASALLLTCSLTSCKHHLTESKAEEIIKSTRSFRKLMLSQSSMG